MADVDPRSQLRVVIVNYNGGELLARAVDSVGRSDWPGPLDIVVVDNASTDDSLHRLAAEPSEHGSNLRLTIVERDENEGFGANNHGFADLLDGDLAFDLPTPTYVALLNPDAMVRPTTFSRLAEALAPDRRIGAAAPKIIFDRPYVQLDVSDGDVAISRVEIAGADLTAQCHQVGAAFRLPGKSGPLWRCSAGTALRVPSRRFGETIELKCDRRSNGMIAGRKVSGAAIIAIDTTGLQSLNIVQNAGTELDSRGNGRNRGFGDVDGARVYGAVAPSWCGAAVMFHADYLRDVGGFEPSYFLYYEDVDLALRGIARGWTTVYVPNAVVEHRHSDRATQGTKLVEVLQHRNRMVMLMRNAPVGFAARNIFRAALTPLSLLLKAVREPRRARPHLRLASWRAEALVKALRAAPSALAGRRKLGQGRSKRPRRVIEQATARK